MFMYTQAATVASRGAARSSRGATADVGSRRGGGGPLRTSPAVSGPRAGVGGVHARGGPIRAVREGNSRVWGGVRERAMRVAYNAYVGSRDGRRSGLRVRIGSEKY